MRSLEVVGCHTDLAYCRSCPENCFTDTELAEPTPATPATDGIHRCVIRRFWRSFLVGIGAAIGRLHGVAKRYTAVAK